MPPLSSHLGGGYRPGASHAGGGAWPGGAGGIPPGIFGGGVAGLFGDGTYSGNIIQGGSVLQPVGGVITITGAATVAPDANGTAFAMCDTLVLDGAGASLTASTACKGLFVIAKTKIQFINSAGASMTAKGVAGQVLVDPTLYSLIPEAYRRKFKSGYWASIALVRDGAAGAVGQPSTPTIGGTGTVGGAWQSGGGGSAGNIAGAGVPSGAGALGSCFSGGAGGGGNNGTSGAPYGGAGGNANTGYGSGGGGAGNPGGTGVANANGMTGTGGLMILAAPSIIIGAGSIVQADGVQGGAQTASYNAHGGGGGSGGGISAIIHGGYYTNSGTVRASGGLGGLENTGSYNGGPGGAGSVNVVQAA